MDAKIKETAGKNVMAFVKKFEKHGPRLPGSIEEQKAADALVKEVKLQTGLDAKKEEFTLRPHSGVASIPILGVWGIVSMIFYFLTYIKAVELAFGIVSLVLINAMWIFAVPQVFRYKMWFEIFFKKAKSSNITCELPARSGKNDITLIYSGHIDTSWNWNLAAYGSPKKMIPLTVIGIFSPIIFLVVAWIKVVGGYDLGSEGHAWLTIVPIITTIGTVPLVLFLSYNKKKASPGAMDNLTGVGLALEVFKYYQTNPELLPDNCRIVFAGLGSEEAGLRGSFAYVKEHFGKEGDDLLIKGKTYVVNIDSVADADHFEVVQGDLWQTTFFNKDLCNLAVDAMTELNLDPKRIYNPIGGCDSTPFHKKGIDTFTFAAQDPVASDYYHTFRDVSARFSDKVVANGFDVLINVTDKIIDYHNKR
ncbi:MAG: M28 family peptidase [Clostridiales bacterium]|jgi:hypothetical protein|nr:M28 family peptidase [Clostridiales bacterium]